MKKIIIPFILALIIVFGFSKYKKTTPRPKLVVGIVIDQMRYDYLTRFANKYGEGGFNRLLNNGFSLENAHFNYMPNSL